MLRNIKIVFGFLIVAVIATSSVTFAETESAKSNLLENSPFIPYDYIPKGGPGAAGKRGAVEFRGVFQFDDDEKFSLYNTQTQKSVWVGYRDRKAPYFVESYDPTKKSITVGIDGMRDTLSLSKSANGSLDINPVPRGYEPPARSSASTEVPEATSREGKEMDPEKRKEMADRVFESFRKYVAERRKAQEEASQ